MPKPRINATAAAIGRGHVRPAAELFSVIDADGDAVARYEFWDGGLAENSGYFSLGGIAQASNRAIGIDAAQLGSVQFVGGRLAGTESVWVRAEAGGEFSDWVLWTMTTTGAAPVASAANRNVHRQQGLNVSTLVSASDADADSVVSYQFWDAGTATDSGYFLLDGVRQTAGAAITVSAASFERLIYVGGQLDGSEMLWVRAADAGGYGTWAAFTATTGNTAPSISANDRLVLLDHYWPWNDLFSVTDAEGDRIAEYELWDSGATASSGYFEIGGVRQAAGQAIALPRPALTDLRYLAGNALGAETLWVRAYDGELWSPWKSWTIETVSTLPPGSGLNVFTSAFNPSFNFGIISITGNHAPLVTTIPASIVERHTVAASTLFTASDEDGDAITHYELEGQFSSFTLAGSVQAGTTVTVSAAQLADLTYTAPRMPGSQVYVSIRAFDGTDWGAWSAAPITITPNHAPSLNVLTSTAGLKRSLSLGTLVSASDTDGDAISAYEFFDPGSAWRSGYFAHDGVMRSAGDVVHVDASEFARFTYVSAADPGSERQWARAYDGYDWGAWASLTLTTVNQRPVVTVSSASMGRNSARAASGLYSVTDADGDAITEVQFWDSGLAADSGYFRVNGQRQAAGVAIPVQGAQLNTAEFVGGSSPGSETLWVRVYDGTEWSAWVSWTMSTTGSAPVVSASNRGIRAGQSVAASALFSVSDADAESPVSYELWDAGTVANSGHFTVNGIPKDAGAGFVLSAAELPNTRYVGGTLNGTETLWVRAADAGGYGNWVSWQMMTGNLAPSVVATSRSLAKGHSASASTLFFATDAESDPIVRYELWDGGTAAGSGHFRVNATPKPAGVGFLVEAADFAPTSFHAGTSGGTETLWARAYDGFDWGAWASLTLTTVNQRPTVTATHSSVAWGQSVSLGPLLTTADADGDAIVQYDFRDGGPAGNSGYISVAGVAQPAGQAILVPAAQLATVHFVGGYLAGAETLWVRVSDGDGWSDWAQWSMTTTGSAPIVTASNTSVGTEMSVAASALFSVNDADNDPITQYEFYDTGSLTTSGHFRLNGVAQSANTAIVVNATDLSTLTYVGGENPGTEELRLRANDGSGFGLWASFNLTTAIRFTEVIGTPVEDRFQTGSLGTDKVYFGLGGSDSFAPQSGEKVMLMGGAGGDSYIIPSFSDTFIIVYEHSNSAGDFIQPGFIVPAENDPAPTAILATVDGRHLLLGDAAAGRLVLVVDWQQPSNQIETWFIGGALFNNGGVFPYADFAAAVAASQPVNITIDQLVAFDPVGLAGFSSAAFNEMLAYYAQREVRIISNRAPSVTSLHRAVPPNAAVPLSSLLAASDPDGDPIIAYRFPGSPRLLVNDTPLTTDAWNGVLTADQFANAKIIGGGYVTAAAYDGIHWSGNASIYLPSPINRAPEIRSTNNVVSLVPGASAPLMAFFAAEDPDGDAIQKYRLSFSRQLGDFLQEGVALGSGTIELVASELAGFRFLCLDSPGNSSFGVAAFDGEFWSATEPIYIRSSADGEQRPRMRALDGRALPGQAVPVTSFFELFDPDGFIGSYTFTVARGSPEASLLVDGTARLNTFTVPADQLGRVAFVGGASGAVAELNAWLTLADDSGFGTTAKVYQSTNRSPRANLMLANVQPEEEVVLTRLLAFSDAETTVTSVAITDLNGSPGSGYFTVNGIRQASNQEFLVGAFEPLDSVRYVGGTRPGVDRIRLRAGDDVGTAYSTAQVFEIATAGQIADTAGSTFASAHSLSMRAETQTLLDFVGTADAADVFSFSLNTARKIALDVTGLVDDADLAIFASNGDQLATSANAGDSGETITIDLPAGSYYARVSQATSSNTNYVLSYAAPLPTVHRPPAVTPLATYIPSNKTIYRLTDLFDVDLDAGLSIYRYEFQDHNADPGSSTVDNYLHYDGSIEPISLLPADLGYIRYIGGTEVGGKDTITVRAFDGYEWGEATWDLTIIEPDVDYFLPSLDLSTPKVFSDRVGQGTDPADEFTYLMRRGETLNLRLKVNEGEAQLQAFMGGSLGFDVHGVLDVANGEQVIAQSSVIDNWVSVRVIGPSDGLARYDLAMSLV